MAQEMTQTIEQLTARVRELEGVYVPSPVKPASPRTRRPHGERLGGLARGWPCTPANGRNGAWKEF